MHLPRLPRLGLDIPVISLGRLGQLRSQFMVRSGSGASQYKPPGKMAQPLPQRSGVGSATEWR